MPRPALIHSLRTWPGLAWAIPLLLLLCWPAAQAQPLLTLDPHPEQARRLGPDGQYWIDHTGRATPDEVMRLPDTAWQATRSDHIFPLHTLADMVWIRFRTAPIGSTHWHWYLEIPYANLDRATLFIQADDGRWTQQDAGDALSVAEWPLPHRQPLLQLRPKADAPVVHLLRIGHANPTSVPVLVTEERQLLRRERNVSVGLGVYFGIAALAVLVALSSAWRGRDLAFVLYALFTLLTALSAASLSGFAGLVLWPRHAAWNHHAATVLPLLTLGAALAFVGSHRPAPALQALVPVGVRRRGRRRAAGPGHAVAASHLDRRNRGRVCHRRAAARYRRARLGHLARRPLRASRPGGHGVPGGTRLALHPAHVPAGTGGPADALRAVAARPCNWAF